MHSKWLEPHVISCNAAKRWGHLSCSGRSDCSFERLASRVAKCPVPSIVISCNAAISSYETNGLWEEASAVLREMPLKWLEPHVVSCNAASSSCEQKCAMDRASALLWEMSLKRLEPHVSSCLAAISS